MKGVVYVAIGKPAQAEADQSVLGLLKHNKYPVHRIEDVPGDLSADRKAHWAKVSMFDLSPFDPTLMLDADTRVHGSLDVGFKALHAGWDIVVVPSVPPHRGAVLWSLNNRERYDTIQRLGLRCHLMYNTGVFFFRKNERTQALFQAWRKEWLEYRDRDQGALLRALEHHPVRLWLLGHPYNSAEGEVVEHLFGRARA